MTQVTTEPAPAPSRTVADARFPCFDGLRALAALAVFAFHSSGITFVEGSLGTPPHWVLNWLSQLGLFGVSTFFVISGFLLYRPFAKAALSGQPAPRWLPFWKRRFFRIFPAYWVALAATVYVLGETPFTSLQEAVFHFGLLENYRGLYIQHGLGVAWTLVIELSFYLALPFIAALLRGLSSSAQGAGARVRMQLAGLAGLAAIALSVRAWWMFGFHLGTTPLGSWFPLSAFNQWLPSYLDWFALGMAMAIGSAWIAAGGRVPSLIELLGRRPWLSWLLALGAYWMVTQLGLALYPESIELSATQDWLRFVLTGLAAALFVLPAVFGKQGEGAIRAFLRHPVMVALGLVSYGIYLWHFPIWRQVLTWHAEHRFPTAAPVQIGAVLALTVTVAAISYVVIERPIIGWSSGRSPTRLRDLRTSRSTSKDPDEPRQVTAAPRPRATRDRFVVAVAIVVIAVVGLILGGRDLRGGASNASGLPNQPDLYSWPETRSTVADGFARPDQAGLSGAGSHPQWTPLAGTWSIAGHRARVAPSTSPSFAVVRTRTRAQTNIRATVVGNTSLSGVAFRCQNAANCWWLEALPGYTTWSVTKIVAGRATSLGNIGYATSVPGTSIAVHTDGDRITIAVNGNIRKVITDPALRDANGVGLAHGAGSTTAGEWKRFESS